MRALLNEKERVVVIFLICVAERVEDGVSISFTCFNLKLLVSVFVVSGYLLRELIMMDHKGM